MSLLERLDRLDVRSGLVRPVDPCAPRPTAGAIFRELVRPPTLWLTLVWIAVLIVLTAFEVGMVYVAVLGGLSGCIGAVASQVAARRLRAVAGRASS
jgi:hypothetical protein